MARGIFIAIGLFAGCVSLAMTGIGRQIEAAQQRIDFMSMPPSWSPFARFHDMLPEIGLTAPLSSVDFDADFTAADAIPLQPAYAPKPQYLL